MKKRYVIGVDVGSSTVKAVFVDTESGKVAATETKEIFPLKSDNSQVIEYDPEDWKAHVKEVLKRGFAHGIAPEETAGICFDDFTVMAFPVEADGTPLANPVHYNDMRHLAVLEEVEQKVGPLCVERNANYMGMYNGLVKQYWWKTYQPEIYRRTAYMVTAVSWINFLLTGNWRMSRSIAGFYGQYNAYTREWDRDILGALDLDPEKFPPLADAGEMIGTVTGEAAEEWGLPEGMAVFAGMDDASPVALTCGTISEGDCYISAGSAANVAIISEKVLSHPTAISYPHCVPEMNTIVAVLTCTGLSYKWVRNELGAEEMSLAKRTKEDPFDILNKEAEASPCGSNGVVFLPFLDGDFTPNNDPEARGAYIGLSTGTTKNDMIRAVLEGVGFSIQSGLEMIRGLGGDPKSLAIAGGIAKSPLWLQIIADITGIPVSLPEETEGAAMGCALVAGVGCGLFDSFRDAIDRTVKIERGRYLPDPSVHAQYETLYGIYRELYGRLKESYASLADYRHTYCKEG